MKLQSLKHNRDFDTEEFLSKLREEQKRKETEIEEIAFDSVKSKDKLVSLKKQFKFFDL